jgi:hypothetical protein
VSAEVGPERRVLVIGALAMLGLVLVGVVSAQLLTRSACEALVPEPLDARAVGTDVAEVLAAALDDLDADDRMAVQAALGALTARLGPIEGLADVTGAASLAALADGEVVALGPTTTVLRGDVGAVRATASIGGVVEGDGSALYALALENPLTGQVDALLPLDAALESGTCVDTATVGTPLAFRLDARDGQLLLFRIDDDADAPRLELRDPVRGQVWRSEVRAPTAPPGVLAERLGGVIGEEVVVVAWHVAPEADVPVVAAYDRVDGALRWRIGVEQLVGLAPDPAAEGDPIRAEVVASGGGHVIVALTRDGRDAPATFVGLSSATGRIRWSVDLAPRTALDADLEHGRLVLVAREDGVPTAYEVDLDGGEARPRTATAGEQVAVALDGERIVLAVDGSLTVVTEDGAETVTTDAWFADVLAVGRATIVLVRSEEGAAAVRYGGS